MERAARGDIGEAPSADGAGTKQATHQRVVVRRRGGPEVLRVAVGPLPEPRAGEVRVKTMAAGISALDLMVRSRWFAGFPRLPFTPGVDVVERVIPLSLTTRFALSLIPDGKEAPMPPDVSKPDSWYRKALAELLDLLASGGIEPVVAERFPLAEAARAQEMLERGRPAGKVVLLAGSWPGPSAEGASP